MSAPTSKMTEIRDYVTNILYIRRPSSMLGDYDALVSHCFNFFHIDRESYTVHFHFRRGSQCEGRRLLREDEWLDESYEVLFAHFVRRVRVRGQNSLSFGRSARESTTPPVIPSPESPWTQPPLPILDDQGILASGYPPVHPVPDVSGLASTPVPPPPAPLQPPPAVRRPAIQRRNTNSTTIYSIGPPIPSTHYDATYFSGPYIFIPLRPGPPRPRSHAQRYSDPFPGFRSQSPAPAPDMTATMMASAPPARARPSAPAAIGSRFLASQLQPDDGFPDRPPVTRRGRPRTGEQGVQRRPLLRNEIDDGSAARQPPAPRHRPRTDQQPVLPPYMPGEYDFPLVFTDDPPVASQQPHTEQESHEDQLEQEVPGAGKRASVESSLESFNFSNFFDDSSEASQQSQQRRLQEHGEQEQEQAGPEEEGRASVARSQDSFGQFATEEIESPLFVTDESERDFEEDLAWESDDEEQAVVEEKQEAGDDDDDEDEEQ